MIFYFYKICNIKNNKFYIGITTDYEKRKKQHFSLLKKGKHPNFKIQKDYDIYGEDSFVFEIIEKIEAEEDAAYNHEFELIQKYRATESYNILEGGKLNPVYSSQVINKIKISHQKKYNNILQYEFNGKEFKLVQIHNGIRDAVRNTGVDFRAIQNCLKSTQSHHDFYWIKEDDKEEWLNRFLKRFTCCVAKIDEKTGEIEDSSLTIQDFCKKYDTTYNKIYASIRQNNRCERKYKFIRITSEDFAKINNLSL